MRRPSAQLIEMLLICDPDVLDAAELDTVTGRVAELRAWLDALQVRVTRRQRSLAAEGRGADPRNQLTRHGKASGKDARAAEERERVCSSMPSFEDALAGGTISSGHVDAVANAARHLDEQTRADFQASADELLADAERLGVDAFARAAKDRARTLATTDGNASDAEELERQRNTANVSRWTDPTTGMCGGATDLADLAPVCEPHHHLVHEGGWTLTMTPDRVATWIRPDGVVHWSGSAIDRRPEAVVA